MLEAWLGTGFSQERHLKHWRHELKPYKIHGFPSSKVNKGKSSLLDARRVHGILDCRP